MEAAFASGGDSARLMGDGGPPVLVVAPRRSLENPAKPVRCSQENGSGRILIQFVGACGSLAGADRSTRGSTAMPLRLHELHPSFIHFPLALVPVSLPLDALGCVLAKEA